jgi:phospholipid/cholesterol/gamma-HCH transport system substrate-binding protein
MPSASHVNWAKLRVTVVTVASLAILSVLVYLLTGGTLLTEKTTLFLFMPDATGLSSGSPVRVNGTGVGKVSSVAFSGSNQLDRIVRVSMSVEKDHLPDIPTDSFAQLSSDSLVGDKYVDITRGKANAPVQPGSEITYRNQPELLKTLDLEQFAQRLRAIDAMLSDIEQGRSRVGQFVLSEGMYDGLLKALAGVERDVRTIAATAGTLGTMLHTDQLYRQISGPLVQVDNALARLQAGQGQFGRLLGDDAQYLQLRDQFAHLRRSIADIRANPFLQSDETYSGWNRALASLIQSADELNANPLLRTSELYDNLNGAAKELANSVREVRRDPQKFLRIKLF